MLARGTVDAEDLHLYRITDDEDEILDIIRQSPVRNGIKFDQRELEDSGIGIDKKDIIL
jgi:hypothetical protein